MSKYRIELTRSNQSALAKAAAKNGRSMVKELNVILAAHFEPRQVGVDILTGAAILERPNRIIHD